MPSLKAKKLENFPEEKVLLEPRSRFANSIRALNRNPGSSLAYHLVRLEQECRGDGEAERVGGLEVDDQLKLGGTFDGQVGRFRPFNRRSTS